MLSVSNIKYIKVIYPQTSLPGTIKFLDSEIVTKARQRTLLYFVLL